MTEPAEEFILASPAKINWFLRVLGRRGDGFHEIETIFQTISLHDRIVCRRSGSYRLSCSDPSVPTGEENLVTRALALLGREGAVIPSFAIRIEKSIPTGGGLGGGSSNAAAVLRAFRDRFAPAVSEERLRELALELGSDVPFFLSGGTAYATGRGEKLEPVPSLEGIRLLLVLPEERVSTAEAYSLIGRGPLREEERWGASHARGIAEKGPLEDPESFTNDFEEVVFERIPRLREHHRALLDEGAVWARMSGSGSTIVGAFLDEESRERARGGLRNVRVLPAETEKD